MRFQQTEFDMKNHPRTIAPRHTANLWYNEKAWGKWYMLNTKERYCAHHAKKNRFPYPNE